MKTLSRLVALGAVASGAGGILLAVASTPAGAATISPGNLVITGPQMVTITAQRDLTDSAQLLVDGTVVDSACAVGCKTTLSDHVNSTSLGSGSHSVVLMEKAGGVLSAFKAAAETITVRLPQSSSASGGSSGSGGSSSAGSSSSGGSGAQSGAVSGGSAGGAGSAGGNSVAAAPASMGYAGPGYGGNGFGSAYSRLDALSGSSALVLPDVAPQNGFKLPVNPPKHARLAGSQSRMSTLTAATWLIGLALGLIMVLTAAHTGAWARRRRRLTTAGAAAGGGSTTGDAVTTTAAAVTTTAARAPDAPADRGGRHRGPRDRRNASPA